MYCATQISTESNQSHHTTPSIRYLAQKQLWYEYLNSNYINTSTFGERIGFADYMYEQEQSGRVLYHMTTTYKPYEDRTYKERDVNNFFINFYVKKFLRHVVDSRRFNQLRHRYLQPICFAFIDEHEPEVVPEQYGVIENNCLSSAVRYNFADRLHHHAILAVHPDTVDRIDRLIGTGSLIKFSKKMMTSDLKRCDAGRILYSSKMLHRYPDFLQFPDTFKCKPMKKKNRAKRVCEALN